MKPVIQRVSRASVSVGGEIVGSIGQGMLVLLGVAVGDGEAELDWMVRKVSGMRIFDDEAGVMNRSVSDIGGGVLVVSQFTLLGDCRKGNRPSWIGAAGHELAVPMYEAFCERLGQALGQAVERGVFGADMKVELMGDGPVTIILEK